VNAYGWPRLYRHLLVANRAVTPGKYGGKARTAVRVGIAEAIRSPQTAYRHLSSIETTAFAQRVLQAKTSLPIPSWVYPVVKYALTSVVEKSVPGGKILSNLVSETEKAGLQAAKQAEQRAKDLAQRELVKLREENAALKAQLAGAGQPAGARAADKKLKR